MFGHLTSDSDLATAAAFDAPRPGDSFHEMLSFRMFVVAVEHDGRVAVLTATPPCTLPADGTVRIYESHDAYRAEYAYGTIPGYWMRLGERDIDVASWFAGWPDPEPECKPCAELLARANGSNPGGGAT